MTSEIIGYAHEFCNKTIRENNNLIHVFVHNLFSFDFFFFIKGIRLCVWRTKQLNISGTNLINAQYANIGDQAKFINIMKYYQQSLSSLAKNASEIEKKNVRASCLKFIEKNETYSAIFNFLPDNDKNWILDYLCGSKRVIPYEKIKTHQDLESIPENDFCSKTEFYSSLKNEIINDKSYGNVKKFRELLCLKKLSELNDIFENRERERCINSHTTLKNVPLLARSVVAYIDFYQK